MTGGRKLKKANRQDVQPLLEKVIRVVCDRIMEEGLQVYLFGSWAQGRALAESDLDIALDAGKPIESVVLLSIINDVDDIPTLRKVDVVDLQALDQAFRRQVLQHGELIYGK